MKFDQLIEKKKAEMLEEAGGVAVTGSFPSTATTSPAVGAATAAAGAATPQTGQNDTPEGHLSDAFKTMNLTDPNVAVKQLNDAMKNAGNMNDTAKLFANVGYDPEQGGFVYLDPAQAQQQAQQEQPQQGQPQQPQQPQGAV